MNGIDAALSFNNLQSVIYILLWPGVIIAPYSHQLLGGAHAQSYRSYVSASKDNPPKANACCRLKKTIDFSIVISHLMLVDLFYQNNVNLIHISTSRRYWGISSTYYIVNRLQALMFVQKD